jgi:diguanylate cyclase (GGDEF)-like protein
MPEPTVKSLSDTCSQAFELPGPTVADCCLVRISPPGSYFDNLIPLGSAATIIGRDPDCTLPLNDEFSSRHHASIDRTAGVFSIRDHGSRNGTYVNGERVDDCRPLQVGDQLRIGNHVFKFLDAGHPEAQYYREMHDLMTSDALTSIANRRYFEESFRREMSRCSRHRRPLGVLLLDLDYFKPVNDTHGHAVGDECLKELCERVRSGIRQEDLFARLGGDEFAVILSEMSAEDCRRVAEKIRARVESRPFCRDRGIHLQLSVSIGIAHSDSSSLASMQNLLIDADSRLYAAKEGGRNCICGPELPTEVKNKATAEWPVISLPVDLQ